MRSRVGTASVPAFPPPKAKGPSRHERGYGYQHVKERNKWAKQVASGRVSCARCGLLIEPGDAWDLDHADDRQGYLGPSHASCNRSAGGRNVTGGHKARTSPIGDTPVETVARWSRHWFGPFDERCPDCRRLGAACDAATGGAK